MNRALTETEILSAADDVILALEMGLDWPAARRMARVPHWPTDAEWDRIDAAVQAVTP
jgi:hypothetical protein